MRPRVVVLIPALDEAEAIGPVVRDFVTLADPEGPWVQKVIVVDNGSRDATAQVAQAAGAQVIHEPQRGYGNACLAGIRALTAEPPDILVFADGDGSNVAAELPLLLAPLINQTAEMVIGSRVRRAEPGSLTLPQKFGNELASLLLRILYDARYTDLGPYRAIRWSALTRLQMADPTYGWTVEMQVKAAKNQVPSVEVDVSNRPRAAGKSKVAGTVRGVVGASYKIMWTIFRHR